MLIHVRKKDVVIEADGLKEGMFSELNHIETPESS